MSFVASCGHEVSRSEIKMCRACWRKRGPDIPDKGRRIGECGHPVSGTVAKVCVDCYRKRGREKFVVSDLPSPDEPIDVLIERRALSYEQKHAAEVARRLIPVRINTDGNYMKGKGDPVYIRERVNHLIEHALLYAAGDRSTDHLSAIRCNAAMLMVLTDG